MSKTRAILGALALWAGCLPGYDGQAPQVQNNQPPETGPEKTSAVGVSQEPTAVRPALPSEQAVAWTESGDPAVLAARALDEGPLSVSSQRHACMKLKFETLGRILEGVGVNMRMTNVDPAPANAAALLPVGLEAVCDGLIPGLRTTVVPKTAVNFKLPDGTTVSVTPVTDSVDTADRVAYVAQPARYLYCDARLTLGLPLYSGRLAEATGLTTASITKQFDLFIAAATEIVRDNLQSATRCKVNGVAPVMFNADNTCNPDGMACLQGSYPSPEQVDLCNRVVTQAAATPAKTVALRQMTRVRDNSPNQIRQFTRVDTTNMETVPAVDALTTGKRLAVASVLSAAHACE